MLDLASGGQHSEVDMLVSEYKIICIKLFVLLSLRLHWRSVSTCALDGLIEGLLQSTVYYSDQKLYMPRSSGSKKAGKITKEQERQRRIDLTAEERVV